MSKSSAAAAAFVLDRREGSVGGSPARAAGPIVDRLLTGGSLLARIGAEDRACLMEHAVVRGYSRGEPIFREGDASDYLYAIATGRVKVCKISPTGKEVILEMAGVGALVGAVATYYGAPFPTSAVALDEATCVLVPRRVFFALVERHPSVVRELLRGLTVRLDELTSRLGDLLGGPVEARFARLFLRLAETCGTPAPGGSTFIPTPLSRQELADLTGTTIETAIRIMSRWTREHIIHTHKDGFTLRNPTVLVRLGGDL